LQRAYASYGLTVFFFLSARLLPKAIRRDSDSSMRETLVGRENPSRLSIASKVFTSRRYRIEYPSSSVNCHEAKEREM